ncbi:hypothetical protein H6F61_27255 [Cyanobacteria bacterium FACHB-472]|nr:hypothetical protein [Cyanobacteria bacterium FACHB-472]
MAAFNEVNIENLTNWMRSLRLNSGTVLHLPPRTISPAIAAVEIQGNTEVDKLLQRCAIAVHEIDTPATEIEPSPGT